MVIRSDEVELVYVLGCSFGLKQLSGDEVVRIYIVLGCSQAHVL